MLKEVRFLKIGRELAVAVKLGGPDANNNNRLRDAIAQSKAIQYD